MDYQRIYNQLVLKRLSETPEGYTEKHHIVPKCMGGTDMIDNLVRLTAREHFIAHQLLVKIFPEKKTLIYAVVRLCKQTKSSKIFEQIRIKNSLATSELHKGKIISDLIKEKLSKIGSRPYDEKFTPEIANHLKECRRKQTSGDGNPMYGKTHTDETKQKIRHKTNEIFKNRFDEIGSYITEETRCKLVEATRGENNGMYGKTHTNETKQKMSTKAKLRPPVSDETKEKMRINSTGRKQSEETKRKKSEKLKGRISPTKGKKVSPETIAKRIETRRLNKIIKEKENE